jgi:hypothetical protein
MPIVSLFRAFLLKCRALLVFLEFAITRCSAGGEQSHKIAQDPLDFQSAQSVCGDTLKRDHDGTRRDLASDQARRLHDAASLLNRLSRA